MMKAQRLETTSRLRLSIYQAIALIAADNRLL